MRGFFLVQTGLITALAVLTVGCRLFPSAGLVYLAWLLRNAVLAGAVLQLLVLLVRSVHRRGLARGWAPIGSHMALLLAAALASAWFEWVLAVVAAST